MPSRTPMTTVMTDQQIKLTSDHQNQQFITGSKRKLKIFPFYLIFIGSAICSRSCSALIAILFHRSETNQSMHNWLHKCFNLWWIVIEELQSNRHQVIKTNTSRCRWMCLPFTILQSTKTFTSSHSFLF